MLPTLKGTNVKDGKIKIIIRISARAIILVFSVVICKLRGNDGIK